MSAVPNLPEAVLNASTNGVHGKHGKNAAAANGKNGANAMGRIKDASGFQLHDTVVENTRPIKVIVIGAGYSGIYCGIRIPERIKNCELVIYEKNAGMGGTWYENRYPGCACDIPSHSYQFSFNPNPNWSSLYAPSKEIQAYLSSTAKKYSADRFIKLEHEIVGCRYDQREGKWHVKVKGPDGNVFEDVSDILISARGNLNAVAWPTIDGLKTFKGEVMHSASWNQSYDFAGKTVGVIGSGSSAIQIIPRLQKLPGTELNCFIRSKTWISPPFAQKTQDEIGMSSTIFTEEQKQRFREDPEHFYNFRKKVEEDSNAVHAITIKGTEMQKSAQEIFAKSMRARLSKKPELFDYIKPDFSPGCRRLTPGPGYLEALVEDNVNFIRDQIVRIDETGVVTDDGKHHAIDVLVCATGFHASAAPPFPCNGVDGLALKDRWEIRADNYLSLAVDGFPNHFTMLGPNSAVGSGSLTMLIEATGEYITKCVRKLQRDNIRSMAVKPARVRDFLQYADAYFQRTVFMDECRSWYRKGDKITGLWPGSTLHALETMRSPRWEDYEYEYLPEPSGAEGNQMAWLGNGWSVNEIEGRDLAFYMTPKFQNPPNAPFPEKNERYKMQGFSY